MKSFKKLFFNILGAFGWHAERKLPLCVKINGQPLVFPPSWRENAIDYLESVVLGKRTHKVLALVPGGMRVDHEINAARGLRNSLGQGHEISLSTLGIHHH